ncbi:SixA phosphatase family protein [Nonomuraea sp. NPDC059194]|uniref:SixA phosphatase family protein n=1 Tax=Nonomuraea sp. NPDC059194 TaxID=3346764 RepID=UPI0036CE0962
MRTLIVLRHAKAVHVPGLADRERSLTDRGERDAVRAGEAVKALGLAPELVLCSPARRTTRTAELAFPTVETSFEGDIYGAYPEDLYELIRRLDPDVETLVLCGHNPSVHEMAMSLTGGDFTFKPGAFAVVEVDAPWVELWPGEGRLVTHWDPKEQSASRP